MDVLRDRHGHLADRDAGTGKPFSARAASVFALRDGKIAHQTDYWDMATTSRQTGLLPAPGTSPAG